MGPTSLRLSSAISSASSSSSSWEQHNLRQHRSSHSKRAATRGTLPASHYPPPPSLQRLVLLRLSLIAACRVSEPDTAKRKARRTTAGTGAWFLLQILGPEHVHVQNQLVDLERLAAARPTSAPTTRHSAEKAQDETFKMREGTKVSSTRSSSESSRVTDPEPTATEMSAFNRQHRGLEQRQPRRCVHRTRAKPVLSSSTLRS